MQQLLGLAIVLGAVFGGFSLMGGTFASIFHPIELLIIGGAAFGALVLGNQRHVLAEMAHHATVRWVILPGNHDSLQAAQLCMNIHQISAGSIVEIERRLHQTP